MNRNPLLPALSLVAASFLVLASTAPALRAEASSFRRGDANADSQLDISDAVYTLRFLFSGGGAPACDDAADANDDGAVDLSDAAFTLNHLFSGGPELPAPGRRCGADPSADGLGCAVYASCPAPGTGDTASLKTAEDCEGVLELLKADLVRRMDAALAENLAYALDLVRWGCRIFAEDLDFLGPAPPPAAGGGGSREAGEAPSEHSGTNNQVEGVDEADFLKTDGAYIYVLADGRFQVIDAWPAAEARAVASVAIDGEPKRLFVAGDRALVYASLGRVEEAPVGDAWGFRSYVRQPSECTYGYDCEFTGDGQRLAAFVYDIADRASPRLLRKLEFSGSYLSGRRIGSSIHTVIIFPEAAVPGLSYWPEALETIWEICWRGEIPFTEEEVRAMFAALREENLALIEAASLVDLLPGVRDTRYGAGEPEVREGLLQDCEEIHIDPAGDGQSFLSLVSFDLDATEDLRATTVLGKPGAVYASRDSLYVATRHRAQEVESWYFESREAVPEATTIHKFRLESEPAGSSYSGSGAVKGRVLNQFSMDEHEGYLRIATTTGRLPSPEVHSTVSVLAESEGGLTLAGQVDRLAPGEDIRSARFDGILGFVVTFKKTDPLFVFDLSDPALPRVRGELKIPGFSTYMHLLDQGHLLSIGYDADDQGSFAYFQGILLQVFDVRDPANPSLLHREVIGTRGSTSDAATNHLAFTYFRSRGLLALPMTICEGGGGGGFGQTMSFSGLLVYRVDLDLGFERLGGVPHVAPGDNTLSCNNWWTRSNSLVKRSIFMDDFVYSVALDEIQVSSVADLEHPVASVPLAAGL